MDGLDVLMGQQPSQNGLDVLLANQPITPQGQQTQPATNNWADVPGNALANLLPSAGNLVGGLVHTVAHPIETAKNLGNIVVGAGEAGTGKIASLINPEWTAPPSHREQLADAVGKFYKDRYGSEEALKTTLGNDPVGAMADLSTVLAGGAGLADTGANVLKSMPTAAKYADALNSTANVLRTGSAATNPMSAVAPIVNGVGNTALFGIKHGLGMTTGVGADTIGQALNAGLHSDKSFLSNLMGDVPMTDVLAQAKSALSNMRTAKGAEYRNGMAQVSGDKTILDFQPIQDAMNNQAAMGTFKGKVINASTADTQGKIASLINDWGNSDPAQFHTPEGLDALKKAINDVRESTDFGSPSRRVADNVYNAVKDQITKQAPVYADVMKSYEDASNQIREIERSLSLGNKSAADTAMRKLQSLTRNNVNTNYSNRASLAKALEDQGGQDIMPALAGQAMNTWMPRGLMGQGEGLATIGGVIFHNPYLALALPFESPKAMGASFYAAGKVAGGINNAATKIPVTSQQATMAALLAAQAGKQQ